MAAPTKFDIRQSETRVLQDQIDSAATTGMDSVLASVNKELTAPGRLIAASTPSLVVTVGSGTVQNPNTLKNRVLPFVNNTPVSFAGGTITFPSTSGTITVSPGVNATITIGVSQFVAVLVQLDTTGAINLVVGLAAASLGAVAIPAGTASFLSLGYIIVQSNASSVIQSVTNAMLYQFVGGGGAGGSASGAAISPASGFQAIVPDTLSASKTLDPNIDSTHTNASYTNSPPYVLLCDKAKTVATNSGTALTISAGPTFTVVAGDIVYVTSGARIGQWRRIATVVSQTSFTLDVAFTGGNASAADTIMVSQAVWTNDLVNVGSSSQKTRPRDFFPTTSIPSINVDYQDSLTSGDTIPDYVDTARLVVSASNSGLQSDTGLATSDTFAAIYTRPASPGAILDYALLANSNTQRLFLAFFCNPANSSVTATANLHGFAVSFYSDSSGLNGGTLNAAFCMSDSSGTAVNCANPTVSGGKSIVVTSFSHVPGVNAGTTSGDLEVLVDGQVIPRQVVGSTLDAYYTETPSTTNSITFWTDLSTYPRSIEIRRRQGVIDQSAANSTFLASLFDVVVGTAAQVTAGQATTSSLQTAINAIAATGGMIHVIGTPITEAISIANPNISIEGKGRSVTINGNVTISSNYALLWGLNFGGNLTLSGNGNYVQQCFASLTTVISDSGAGNMKQIVVGS